MRLTSGFLRAQNDLPVDIAWESNDDIEDVVSADLHDNRLSVDGQVFNLKIHSGSHGNDMPKPTTTLSQPLRLSPTRLRGYKFLSTMPMEKIDDGGWDTSRGRDYYLALSPEGEPCWVFHDRVENEHYLYGY